ncbi:VWA domain-containing protein [Sphingomonas glaciei]|uniref:VWA domain-containing protein n=1 Tax=Sphingomonas glaciei TaxID=2938948 RepID=A0ABY5MVI0_9SPHN|nr:VWA domain-containing protein [Sphingomonas glaciei]UUR07986.1 VWA domain-containing protein [Sphingomonas glaciei]
MGLGGDARIAARLVAAHPQLFGGLWIKDEGGAEHSLAALTAPTPLRKLPATVDPERLDGGLDVAATLAASRPVRRAGLLEEARGGLLLVPGAERLSGAIAGRIAAAMDDGGPDLLLLDRGEPDEAAIAPCLLERVAFHLLGGSEHDDSPPGTALSEDEARTAVAEAAAMLGVAGARADLFALHAVRAHAALRGSAIDSAALAFALRTVLAPRATRLPAAEPQPEQAPDQPPPPSDGQRKLEDVVLDAVRTALPSQLLASLLAAGDTGKKQTGAGKAGRRLSPLHGRLIGARAGKPGNGARLAILDTLRAAAPWQRLRGRVDRIKIARDDLRIRRHEAKSTALTVFAVDASGSAAAQRLAEAKGAVESLLQQSYVRRAEVALVAIRGDGATLLLPPTRSLTRARRLLAELPGGGGTPLAAGIDAARELALSAVARGRVPALVVLTDGRANVALDGRQDRSAALADAAAAARRVAGSSLRALVIDIGPRARPEASALAKDMTARYLHLPLGQASAVAAAVTGAAA